MAVLAHALAPRRAPLDVAAGLEQQLWLDRKEADGAVGDAYLCALRTLWDVLSPQVGLFMATCVWGDAAPNSRGATHVSSRQAAPGHAAQATPGHCVP